MKLSGLKPQTYIISPLDQESRLSCFSGSRVSHKAASKITSKAAVILDHLTWLLAVLKPSLPVDQRQVPFLVDSSIGPLTTWQLLSSKVRAPKKEEIWQDGSHSLKNAIFYLKEESY